MKIKFISYGHKFYEAEGIAPPYHDFLFNLRDLKNPYWIPELKPHHGLETPIQEFFGSDENIQERLNQIIDMTMKFIKDFAENESRTHEDHLVFAFKCTGGKHRSPYFADQSYLKIKELLAKNPELNSKVILEVEHIDLHKYLSPST